MVPLMWGHAGDAGAVLKVSEFYLLVWEVPKELLLSSAVTYFQRISQALIGSPRMKQHVFPTFRRLQEPGPTFRDCRFQVAISCFSSRFSIDPWQAVNSHYIHSSLPPSIPCCFLSTYFGTPQSWP